MDKIHIISFGCFWYPEWQQGTQNFLKKGSCSCETPGNCGFGPRSAVPRSSCPYFLAVAMCLTPVLLFHSIGLVAVRGELFVHIFVIVILHYLYCIWVVCPHGLEKLDCIGGDMVEWKYWSLLWFASFGLDLRV